jgi:hypothetical protein
VRPSAPQAGYALLAALLITALGALLAATAVAAAVGGHAVAASDRGEARATSLAWQDLDARAEDVRWRPWRCDAPLTSSGWPTLGVHAEGADAGSRSVLDAVLELRALPWCAGLVVAGDLEFNAPATVLQSGAYVGGCVRGREWLSFTATPGAGGGPPAADLVHGDRWPAAAVHALGGIWATGAEIHAGGGQAAATWAADTDMDTADPSPEAITARPDAVWLAAVRTHAVSPGPALCGDVLDVSLLPATPPGAVAPGVVAAGYVVVVDATTPLTIVGVRPATACPLAVVVRGDAEAGAPGRLSLRGALVVCGRLDVTGPVSLEGAVYAGAMTTLAGFTLTTDADWRTRMITGLASLVIVRLARG